MTGAHSNEAEMLAAGGLDWLLSSARRNGTSLAWAAVPDGGEVEMTLAVEDTEPFLVAVDVLG